MPNSAKIGIIGAGSAQFSAGIVRDLCVAKGLEGSHVCFMDVDQGRLDKIYALAEKITGELGCKLTFQKTSKMEEAIRGMDFVLNTAQVGGHAWSEAQRELGEKHGYYRGLWVGQIGQMAFFLEVAKLIEAVAPNAWLIQSANPVFEGCTLMTRETKTRVIGLCHGHYGYREIADVLGLDRKDIQVNMIGFNHWIWMTEFRYKGKDAYPLIDEWIKTKAEDYWKNHKPAFADNQMSRAAVEQYQLYGLFPIGDTPRFAAWWQNDSLESKKKYFGHLGGFDSEIGWKQYLDEMFGHVEKIEKTVDDPKTRATDIFKPVQSDEQIVPIINSILNDAPGIYQVNIPNKGSIIEGFPEDLVIECRGVINGGGVCGLKEKKLPESIISGVMIPRWAEAESVLLAAKECSYNAFLAFVLSDRRTKSKEQAEAFLKEWLGDSRNEYIRKHLK
ncbi:alpha-glucosidase [Spirochaetia bacterium]|nr:alpha-glucosidase [Spirochaetia bacterium]